METERVFLLLAACASAAWARGKGGAGTGGGGNSWREREEKRTEPGGDRHTAGLESSQHITPQSRENREH